MYCQSNRFEVPLRRCYFCNSLLAYEDIDRPELLICCGFQLACEACITRHSNDYLDSLRYRTFGQCINCRRVISVYTLLSMNERLLVENERARQQALWIQMHPPPHYYQHHPEVPRQMASSGVYERHQVGGPEFDRELNRSHSSRRLQPEAGDPFLPLGRVESERAIFGNAQNRGQSPHRRGGMNPENEPQMKRDFHFRPPEVPPMFQPMPPPMSQREERQQEAFEKVNHHIPPLMEVQPKPDAPQEIKKQPRPARPLDPNNRPKTANVLIRQEGRSSFFEELREHSFGKRED